MFETRADALGAERRVVVTHSTTFHNAQTRGFAQTLADVIAAYRSQAVAEAGFRQMKDPHVVSFSPMFHWTDQKVRVHAFYCVAALAVAHIMRRQAARADVPMSVRELLATLAGIQETVLLYQGDTGRPRARHMLTDTTPTQRRLFELFDLNDYAPTR